MKKRVLFRAPVLTQSGYGVHARQILKWLKGLEEKDQIQLQVQALPWGDTPWYINPDEKDGLIGYVMSKTGPLTPIYDVTVQLQLPNEWDSGLGRTNIGVTAAVETTRCNPEWSQACFRMTKVIVPSEHSRKSLVAPVGNISNIDVIPESYLDQITTGTKVLDLPGIETSFNFLVHGQITGMHATVDRKNIFNTIKWICETFRSTPDVGIILKTNLAKNTIIDRKITGDVVAAMLREVRGGSKVPPVYLLHGDMSDDESAALYRHPSIKALVSLSRGEGFGLPILEASCAGVPVIATNWSAYVEFLGDQFTPVEYSVVPIPKSRVDDRIFMAGASWAETNELDFKMKAKAFYTNPDSAKKKAIDLAPKLQASHSQESIAKRYSALLEEFLT